jgi:hypothetical protein
MVFGWMTAAHKQKSFPVLSKQGGGVIMTLVEFPVSLKKTGGEPALGVDHPLFY